MAQANPDFNEIRTTTMEYYANKRLANQIYDGTPLLKWMRARGRTQEYDGGDPIVEPILHEENTTVRFMTDLAELDFRQMGGIGAAHYTGKLLTATAVLPWMDRFRNSGSARVIDLWDAKVDQMKMSTSKLLNREIIKGDPTTNPATITGLTLIIDSAGTLGNISRTSNTFWQAYEEGTAGPLTPEDMRTAIFTITRAMPDNMPDLILTTQALFSKYQSLILPAYQVSDLKNADLGVPTANFMGIPMMWDPEVPEGVMLFINTKYLKLRVHSQANMEMSDRDMIGKQLVDGMFVYWVGNLTTNGPRYLGKLTGRTA